MAETWCERQVCSADVQRARRIRIPYASYTGLTDTDKRARLQYYGRVLSMTYANPDFFSNIWFSDESHIHLNGYINRQITHFLGFEQPDAVQKPLRSVRVTIWCAVSGHGILGPYFFKVDARNPLTVNQERYREIIIATFVRYLKRSCRARNLELQPTGGGGGVTCLSATTFW